MINTFFESKASFNLASRRRLHGLGLRGSAKNVRSCGIRTFRSALKMARTFEYLHTIHKMTMSL